MSTESPRCWYCDYLPEDEYLCDPTSPTACEPCRKLSEMAQKVKEIRKMLVGLADERRKLKEQLNNHHSRLIRRLPTEITAEIFELCIPFAEDFMDEDFMDLNLDDVPSRSTLYVPLVLSSVCTRWRDIAYSTPRLWRTLLLFFPSSSPRFYPKTSLIKKWIRRARKLPLSILLHITSRIHDSTESDSDSDSDMGSDISNAEDHPAIPIIETLNDYSTRWSELQYKGPHSLLRWFSIDHEAMHTLHLENRSPYCPDTLYELNPRRLKILKIDGLMLTAVIFDCNNLTELTLERYDLVECFEAIRIAPYLRKCIFHWPRDSSLDAEANGLSLPQSPIMHTRLQELEFPTVLCKDILELLLCPSLKSLTLDPSYPSSTGSKWIRISLVINFLQRSECSLERLTFVYNASFSADITLMCQGIPTLQHLSMTLIHSDRSSVPSILYALLAKMTTIDGRKEPRYLPALRSLCVENDDFPSFQTILAMRSDARSEK